MNQKELNEIRRRIRPERSSMNKIYGCYVNSNKEIISYIEESLGVLSETEAEQYLTLLRKTLSGGLGRGLVTLSFATKQVMDSDEHRLLTALRKSGLEDAELREQFFHAVAETLEMEDTAYLILLAYDAYDVPHFGKDGAEQDSSEVYKYLLCSVCPVKSGKAKLGFDNEEKRFHTAALSQLVSSPELGFLFPTFDDRSTNIYNALFYSHNVKEFHQEFIDTVFKTEVPMPAGQQREAFGAVLSEALSEECSYDVLQAIHEQMNERIIAHKESRDPQPLEMTVEELSEVLVSTGLSEERAGEFREKCAEQFGEDALLSPENLIDSKHLKLKTPEVSITVDPKNSYMVETRIIDGRKYILIAADNGVELNGVTVNIEE